LKTYRIIGWVLLLVAAAFWVTAIGGALSQGFFEDQSGVQLMMIGGAISMVGGTFLWYGD